MKKVLLMMVMLAATVSLQAQKFALVDMDYIFKNIPAYERANEQLAQVSRKW
jgi:outer membrane protein